jgi:hypothetical protein
MHQQLWGYKVEWKSVSRGTGGKKVEYHWSNPPYLPILIAGLYILPLSETLHRG